MALIHIHELLIAYAKLFDFPWQINSVILCQLNGANSGLHGSQVCIKPLSKLWVRCGCCLFKGLSLSHIKKWLSWLWLRAHPIISPLAWWDIPLYHYTPLFNNCYTIIPLLSHYPIIPCFSPNLLGQITLDQARLMDLRRLRIGAAHLAKTSPVKP